MKLISLCILFFLFSCASQKKDLKNEVDNGDVSMQSILDISRSSYLKGCVDGITHLTKKQSKGVYFDLCKTKAILHESDIKDILTQSDNKTE